MATLRHEPHELTYAKAKYKYTAQNTDELDFPKGALLQIVNKRDSDWWEGIYNQKHGWLPSSYVKPVKFRASQSPSSKPSTSTSPAPYLTTPSLTKQNSHQKRTSPLATNSYPLPALSAAELARRSTDQSNILRELISSEKQLILSMKHVLSEFSKCTTKPKLDQIKNMQTVVEKLLKFHRDNLASLDENTPVTHLVHAIPVYEQFYAEYLMAKFPVALDAFRRCDKVGMIYSQDDINSMTAKLSGAGIKRLADYLHYFQELSRFMPPNASETEQLDTGIAALQALYDKCTRLQRVKESCMNLSLQQIRGWEGSDLKNLPADAIYMSQVSIQKSDYATQPYYMVLLKTELIRLAISKRLSAYTYEGRIPLRLVSISKHSQTAFLVKSSALEDFLVFCDNAVVCDEWLDYLQPAPVKTTDTPSFASTNTSLTNSSTASTFEQNQPLKTPVRQLPHSSSKRSANIGPFAQTETNRINTTKTITLSKKPSSQEPNTTASHSGASNSNSHSRLVMPKRQTRSLSGKKFYVIPHKFTSETVPKEASSFDESPNSVHTLVTSYLDLSKKGEVVRKPLVAERPKSKNNGSLRRHADQNSRALNADERAELEALRVEVKELRQWREQVRSFIK